MLRGSWDLVTRVVNKVTMVVVDIGAESWLHGLRAIFSDWGFRCVSRLGSGFQASVWVLGRGFRVSVQGAVADTTRQKLNPKLLIPKP